LINSGSLIMQFVAGGDPTQMTSITQIVGTLLCICGMVTDLGAGFLYPFLGARQAPVSAGAGALGGALAGLIARFVSSVIGSCISVVVIPIFQSRAADLPPELAESAAGLGMAGSILGIFISVCIFLFMGGILGAIGGVIGGATVGKGQKPATESA
jgi:hypothetical protein